MIEAARANVAKAIKSSLLFDGLVTFTGDDICLIMSHPHGNDFGDIHEFAWDTFLKATAIARECGCYAAGQDLLVDAPSGNVRGAGPGVAEITFELQSKHRPAESFIVLTADKCGPGAYNLPLFLMFADPMYCPGLMLPNMIKGFTFEIVDMNATPKEGSHVITLNAPEDYYKIAFLLRDNDRFGIRAIYSRTFDEHALSASTDRLHSIAGKYTGKDDPVALIRTQGIFPAPEEIVSPFVRTHYTGGGARGSHNMPLMPMPINSPVTGMFAIPIVSCLGFSMDARGKFSHGYVDFFASSAWDFVRLRAQERAIELRNQGWSGPAMLPYDELEYGGFKDTMADLMKQFKVKK
jgi:fructose 1,6-bisphosphate aldolase/phosphatase